MRAIYIDETRRDGTQSGRWIYPSGPVRYVARRAQDGHIRHTLAWTDKSGQPRTLSYVGFSVRLTSQTDAS